MAVLDVCLYPDDPLTRKADPVTDFGPDLAALVADMFDTMDAFEGSGLAAPQVGVSQRFFVLRHPENNKKMCVVNPELSEFEGEVEAEEGCLSLPYVYAGVKRAQQVHVIGQDLHGQPLDFIATDWLARIMQHETDHLDGIVFPDRLDVLSREDKMGEWEAVRMRMRSASVEGVGG
ncbi:MAG TPA: peptide deformylase [Candidatus Hydrogenedentes bacterium]|nr:peptide deformylase [Candidatus Hydrogenedentota bacterium]HPG68931.1 peptide deformylase [Candidatus Hydrogenedentota bacterium]